MQYRVLGPSGLKVSVVALGAAGFGRQLDAKGADPVLAAALEAGVNFVDTAEAYPNSEIVVGEVLRGRRDRVILATKFNPFVAENLVRVRRGPKDIRAAVEGSLRRLQTDHIDIFYLHTPDVETPIADTLQAMGDMVREGKVRYLAASNMTGAQVREADTAARTLGGPGFIAHQNHYSLIDRRVESESLQACRELGLGFVGFAPVERGLLLGRYTGDRRPLEGSRMQSFPGRPFENTAFDKAEAVMAFAKARGLSQLQVALGGILARDGVTSLLVGASTVEQARENVAATDWIPAPDVLAALDAL